MEENDEIIILYNKVKREQRYFPKNTWNDSAGKKNFIILFRHLIKSDESKERLSSLTLKFFKNHNIYIPLKIHFEGKIFNLIEYCYPGKIKIFEMKNVPKNYWKNPNNVKEAFLFLIKGLSNKEVLNLDKKWFYENKLSTPLSKQYRNSPYLFLSKVYFNGVFFKRDTMFKYFWNRDIAAEMFIKLIEEQRLSIKNNKNMFTAKWFKENGFKTPLDKFFKNSPKNFLTYIDNYKKNTYRN